MCEIKDQSQNSVGSWVPLGRAAWTGGSDCYSAEKSEEGKHLLLLLEKVTPLTG